MRYTGVTARGIITPIFQEGDDLVSMIRDSLLTAAEKEGFPGDSRPDRRYMRGSGSHCHRMFHPFSGKCRAHSDSDRGIYRAFRRSWLSFREPGSNGNTRSRIEVHHFHSGREQPTGGNRLR